MLAQIYWSLSSWGPSASWTYLPLATTIVFPWSKFDSLVIGSSLFNLLLVILEEHLDTILFCTQPLCCHYVLPISSPFPWLCYRCCRFCSLGEGSLWKGRIIGWLSLTLGAKMGSRALIYGHCLRHQSTNVHISCSRASWHNFKCKRTSQMLNIYHSIACILFGIHWKESLSKLSLDKLTFHLHP